MNILVIVGDCLRENSSANLCHCAYIKGLLDLGYNIDLLSKDDKDCNIDENIVIPKVKNSYTYYGVSLYERLSNKLNKKKQNLNCNNVGEVSTKDIYYKKGKVTKIKEYIRGLYGVHKSYIVWHNRAKFFKSNKIYDCVISLSTPPVSHLTAKTLLEKGNIKCKRWIQIWEDPWYLDLSISEYNKETFNEEQRLVKYADKIIYVSPLTLKYQQEIYKESSKKMDWIPLPYYYKDTEDNVTEIGENNKNIYGYFGNYDPNVRDLTHFYNSACKLGINVNICGNPSNLYKSTDKIKIYPRLSLDKLNIIEKKTNVLIFLCNLKGGQIPGKIYQYSATNKTILFILDGTEEEKIILKEYFSKFNRYVFCDNTEESILEALKMIENGKLDGINNEPVEYFSPKNIMKMILNDDKGNINEI